MVGTIEQVIEMKNEQRRLEEISDWELEKLPNGIRIDIPLKSATHMSRIGAILVEYGEAMQRVARRREDTPYQIMWRCWSMAREVRKRIEGICNFARLD